MGAEVSYMATNIDSTAYDGCVRLGLVCGWAGEESDESASWDWLGDLCVGALSGYWGVVGA